MSNVVPLVRPVDLAAVPPGPGVAAADHDLLVAQRLFLEASCSLAHAMGQLGALITGLVVMVDELTAPPLMPSDPDPALAHVAAAKADLVAAGAHVRVLEDMSLELVAEVARLARPSLLAS